MGERHYNNRICDSCGKNVHINKILGKCVKCGKIVCNSKIRNCGNSKSGKVYCKECFIKRCNKKNSSIINNFFDSIFQASFRRKNVNKKSTLHYIDGKGNIRKLK